MRSFIPVALLLFVGACAKVATPVAPMPSLAPPPPQPRAGLERVLGAAPEAVIALLGRPTLDRQEGPGRQLQFARGPCVLDLFFYPKPGGGGAAARHVEARFRDGRPLDAASCLQSQIIEAPIG